MDIAKIFAAFGLGIAMLAGLQSTYVWSVQQYLKSDRAKAGMPPIGQAVVAPKFDPNTIKAIVPKYPPIDTTAGQRAAITSMAHRTYLQHRAAANAAPLPPRIPGFRR